MVDGRSFTCKLGGRALVAVSVLLAAISSVRASGFGEDRRVPLPAGPPYASLVRTLAHNGIGCGVLVGPDLVVTVAHAVADANGRIYDDAQVELGDWSAPSKARVLEGCLMSPPDPDFKKGQDWAVLRLDRPIGWRYGWLPVLPLSNAQLKGVEVEFFGFGSNSDEARPEFAQARAPYQSPGVIRNAEDNLVFTDCPIWGGSSGGPLITRRDGKPQLVALVNGGVEVPGEQLSHGFRATYTKELGNLAVPARQWQATLEAMQRPATRPDFHTLFVRNHAKDKLQVSIRYNSLYADPAAPWISTPWLDVAPGQRAAVVKLEDGCAEAETFVAIRDGSGKELGSGPWTEFPGDERRYVRKRMNFRETTYSLP